MGKTGLIPSEPDGSESVAARPVISQSGALPLPEWLDVNWFYPQGFRKERIVETRRSWVVLGNEFVYKFLKVENAALQAGSPEFFRERWRLSCEEVIDNRFTAPSLYVGLRLLRWIDDEPEWISETPSGDIDPLRPPSAADDVAIVMRRVPRSQFAHEQLKAAGSLSGTQLFKLAGRLTTFHSRKPDPEIALFHSTESAVESLRHHYVAPLHEFILTHGSFLDPFSQIAFEELRGYLARFLEKHAALIGERFRSGAFVDCHGSLRADRIAFNKGDEVTIFGRLPRKDPMRLADALSDAAALAGDFEARGYPAVARRFETNYFKHQPRVDKELYNFYKVAEAARRAQILFRGQVDDEHTQAPSFLTVALKHALRLHLPYLIVIGGTNENESLRLAKSVEALLGCTVLSPGALDIHYNNAWSPPPVQLERLLTLGESRFSRKQGLVLVWPLNREDERLQIQRFSKANGTRLLFVSLDGPEHGEQPLGRKLRSIQSDFTQHLSELDTPHLLLEPSLPQPDLAMTVLRGLR